MLLCMIFVAGQLFQATIVHFIYVSRKLIFEKKEKIESIASNFKENISNFWNKNKNHNDNHDDQRHPNDGKNPTENGKRRGGVERQYQQQKDETRKSSVEHPKIRKRGSSMDSLNQSMKKGGWHQDLRQDDDDHQRHHNGSWDRMRYRRGKREVEDDVLTPKSSGSVLTGFTGRSGINYYHASRDSDNITSGEEEMMIRRSDAATFSQQNQDKRQEASTFGRVEHDDHHGAFQSSQEYFGYANPDDEEIRGTNPKEFFGRMRNRVMMLQRFPGIIRMKKSASTGSIGALSHHLKSLDHHLMVCNVCLETKEDFC